MRITAVQRHRQVRDKPASYPRLILERGTRWIDIAPSDTTEYETLFDVYVDLMRGRRQLLGSIKILQRGAPSVTLPRELEALPNDCCSLGQTVDYYAALEALDESTRRAILAALRDVTVDEAVARDFEKEPGFCASLTRFSEARRIYHYRAVGLHRAAPSPEPLHLRFEASLPGFSKAEEDRHRLDLTFQPEPGSFGRLAAIVGKNGTGKTTLLARLAAALWGMRRYGEERLELSGPPVGRVIAVSYSPLDAFERPPHVLAGDDDSGREARPVMDNYRYCGFRDHRGALRPELLFASLQQDFEEVGSLGRLDQWKRMVAETRLAEDDPDFAEALSSNDVAGMLLAAKRLGAGQKTALTVLTRILASARNGVFLLIDEPELNLHPGLLSSLLRVVHAWLDDFDGYGVVATHSPIGLQEIPGRNVRVLRRVGRVPLIQPYPAESFGESLSDIVTHVFGLDERDKNYAAVLRDLLSRGMSPEQIEAAFGRPLSFNARMALRDLSRQERERA